jgi:hypothetical protein
MLREKLRPVLVFQAFCSESSNGTERVKMVFHAMFRRSVPVFHLSVPTYSGTPKHLFFILI